ncbi:cbb3-type cytochrome oxidase assembly protein CcoS [bacterium]|nr:cbb3-type cytochrome oxidase assembly protein CcoS [bacterium]
MDIVVMLVFISLVLVCGAIAFFVSRLRGGDFDHGARLSLLPLEDDAGSAEIPPAANPEEGPAHDN